METITACILYRQAFLQKQFQGDFLVGGWLVQAPEAGAQPKRFFECSGGSCSAQKTAPAQAAHDIQKPLLAPKTLSQEPSTKVGIRAGASNPWQKTRANWHSTFYDIHGQLHRTYHFILRIMIDHSRNSSSHDKTYYAALWLVEFVETVKCCICSISLSAQYRLSIGVSGSSNAGFVHIKVQASFGLNLVVHQWQCEQVLFDLLIQAVVQQSRFTCEMIVNIFLEMPYIDLAQIMPLWWFC